jgi:hypothetical protein
VTGGLSRSLQAGSAAPMRSGRFTLAAVGDGPLTNDEGVGGRLEVVAVGLPAGALAFGERAQA